MSFHGLRGNYIGTQNFELCPSSLTTTLTMLRDAWKVRPSTTVSIHEVHPQPQSYLNSMTHFILEFSPAEVRRCDNVVPAVVEHISFGKGGVPDAKWISSYVPRCGDLQDWSYLVDDDSTLWFEGLRPEPDGRLQVHAGALIVRCSYEEAPTLHIPEFVSRLWPDVYEHHPQILRHRDDFPCREIRVVMHCLALRGDLPKSRNAIVAREHCSMPAFLVQLIADTWPELEGPQIAFLQAQDEIGHLHFVVADYAVGYPKLCRLKLLSKKDEEETLATFMTAFDATLLDHPLQLLRSYGIDDYVDLSIDVRDGFEAAICPTVISLRLHTSANKEDALPTRPDGQGPLPHVISLEKILTENYNPLGRAVEPPEGPGIDFTEVLNLCSWLDAATATTTWLLPEGAEWHAASIPWIHAPWWDYERADRIQIYTDGSAFQGGSCCAAVIWILSDSTWYFGGYLRHVLPGRPCAHRAELHGILLGCQWLNHALAALHTLYATTPEIQFLFDATSADYKAFGEWGGTSYGPLVGNIRSVCYFLESRFAITFAYAHVLGHTGDPGNEAADTIARLHSFDLKTQSSWLDYFDRAEPVEIHWLWTIWKPEWRRYWNGTRLVLPTRSSTTPSVETFGTVKEPAAHRPATTTLTQLTCSISSANVLTLLPAKKSSELGIQGRARSEALQEIFDAAGYHIVGVQETRLRKEPRIDQEKYFVFSSTATARGTFGIQLWFSRTNSLSAEGHFFKRDHFKILAKDPRHLIIKVAAPFFKAIVIAAHAPTSQAAAATLETWWKNLSAAVPARFSQWPRILLVDANARLGSFPSRAIGSQHEDEQDVGGDCFHDFLLHNHQWVPATFEGVQEGPGGTWRHPRTEQWIRGDYVCLPQQWQLTSCRAHVARDLDISLRVDDHSATSVHFAWTAEVIADGGQRRTHVPLWPSRTSEQTYLAQNVKPP